MGRMAREFFAASPVLALPVFALVVFTVVFVAISIRAMRMKQQDAEACASLPLVEDGHGQG